MQALHPLLKKLTGGDRRSIGRADEVAAEVIAEPSLFLVLFGGMLASDPLVRMRSADAAEKVTRDRPDLLQPFKGRLLREVAVVPQQEVHWHVAQMLPRLRLTPQEQKLALSLLDGYLEESSAIVKTFSMAALAQLAEQDPRLRARVRDLLEKLTSTGSPAMKSRGRKLLARLSSL